MAPRALSDGFRSNNALNARSPARRHGAPSLARTSARPVAAVLGRYVARLQSSAGRPSCAKLNARRFDEEPEISYVKPLNAW